MKQIRWIGCVRHHHGVFIECLLHFSISNLNMCCTCFVISGSLKQSNIFRAFACMWDGWNLSCLPLQRPCVSMALFSVPHFVLYRQAQKQNQIRWYMQPNSYTFKTFDLFIVLRVRVSLVSCYCHRVFTFIPSSLFLSLARSRFTPSISTNSDFIFRIFCVILVGDISNVVCSVRMEPTKKTSYCVVQLAFVCCAPLNWYDRTENSSSLRVADLGQYILLWNLAISRRLLSIMSNKQSFWHNFWCAEYINRPFCASLSQHYLLFI